MNQQFCTQCGAKLPEKGNFCPECGAPIEHVAAPPSTQPPVQAEKSGQQPAAPRSVLFGLAGAAVVAVLIAVVYFAFLRPATVEPVAMPNVQNEQDIPFPDVARIPVAEAYARFEDGSALFVDVRDGDSYSAAHIPNAVWIPLTDLNARHTELPKDALILTYCT